MLETDPMNYLIGDVYCRCVCEEAVMKTDPTNYLIGDVYCRCV